MYGISQGHTWPGQKVYLFFLLSHSPDLWQGGNPSQWGSSLCGTYLEFGPGWTRDSCSFTCQVVPQCLDQDTSLPLSPEMCTYC